MEVGYYHIERIITSIPMHKWVTRRRIRGRTTKINRKLIKKLIQEGHIKRKERKEILKGYRGKAGNKFIMKDFKTRRGYGYKLTLKGDMLRRLFLLLSNEKNDFKRFIMEKYLSEEGLRISNKGKEDTKI